MYAPTKYDFTMFTNNPCHTADAAIYTITLGENAMPKEKDKRTVATKIGDLEHNMRFALDCLDRIRSEEIAAQKKKDKRKCELVKFAKAAAIVAGLLLVFFAGKANAQSPLCPFGNCPKVTPLSCFESLFRPECKDTHIDWGNDLQEWAWISSQYPKQIKVAGQYIHTGQNQTEYFRCRMLREKRKRTGKPFVGWVKVDCRERLK